MHLKRHFTICAVAAGLVACGRPDVSMRLGSLCGVDLIDTDEWLHHDEGVFAFRAPADYGAPRREAMDSYAASWQSDVGRLSYDWSPYTGDLPQLQSEDGPGVMVCDPGTLAAAGLVATETGTDGSGPLVAALWTGLPGATGLEPDNLLLVVQPSTATRLAEALTILATVHIREPGERTSWPGQFGLVICPEGGTDDECEFVPSGAGVTSGR